MSGIREYGTEKVLQRRTVLVAEDVDSNFLLLKTLLGKRCNLLWAKNGEDAVNQFKEHQPDLILMDIKMPIWMGWRLRA